MELDEAIKHAEEVAEQNEEDSKTWIRDGWQSGFKNLTPEKEAKYYAERVKLSDGCAKCAEEHRQLAEWLKELKRLREQTRWIPCSDRLPEELVNHLGWIERDSWVDGDDYPTRKQEIAIGWHIKGRWHFDGYAGNTECIAWMPLPEPYKKEDIEPLKTETKKCPICGSDLYEYCFMCCYEGEKVMEMMTLDQAIKHCEEKAEEKQKDYERACAYNISSEGCLECAEEHRQLAEWLKELKRVRELPWLKELKALREQKRPHGECRTCKHYIPYREQFSYRPRGDGYCKSTVTTSEGKAYINCHDEWYCANYEKAGEKK